MSQRNTKYLEWTEFIDEETNTFYPILCVSTLDGRIVLDKDSEIRTCPMSGWSGFRLFKQGAYDIRINAATARQLSRHLKHVSQEFEYDIQKIKYWI